MKSQRIELSYAIGARGAGAPRIRNALMEMLQAVRDSGSISGAARTLGLSYRHVWGEIKRWEELLGHRLVAGEVGQAAQLSAFGDKLLRAERQAQARLSAQIETLHADLERAFAMAVDDGIHVLGLHASHDDALTALRTHAAATAQLHLDIHFSGSVDAVRALSQGHCAMAAFHVREHSLAGSLAQRTYKPLLKPQQHSLIGFARRVQGLMVAPGNPLGLRTMADVERHRARFVNRAPGSGTRVLLDELLSDEAVAPRRIDGYERCEPSHAAVAHAVHCGQADAGLGPEYAARSAGLDFVPMAQERYHLACLKSVLEEPATRALVAVLRSAAWQQRLGALPGCQAAASGEVQSLPASLPWWTSRSDQANARR